MGRERKCRPIKSVMPVVPFNALILLPSAASMNMMYEAGKNGGRPVVVTVVCGMGSCGGLNKLSAHTDVPTVAAVAPAYLRNRRRFKENLLSLYRTYSIYRLAK